MPVEFCCQLQESDWEGKSGIHAVFAHLGNLDLGLGVEEGIGELLALAKSALDDFEARDCILIVSIGCVAL